MTLEGSCLCRGVRYRIHGPVSDDYHCHSSMFRTMHAAAFRTCGRIRSADWQLLQGQELIRF